MNPICIGNCFRGYIPMDHSCKIPYTSEPSNEIRGKWSAKGAWALGLVLRGAQKEMWIIRKTVAEAHHSLTFYNA